MAQVDGKHGRAISRNSLTKKSNNIYYCTIGKVVTWNARGPGFESSHKQFDRTFDMLLTVKKKAKGICH